MTKQQQDQQQRKKKKRRVFWMNLVVFVSVSFGLMLLLRQEEEPCTRSRAQNRQKTMSALRRQSTKDNETRSGFGLSISNTVGGRTTATSTSMATTSTTEENNGTTPTLILVDDETRTKDDDILRRPPLSSLVKGDQVIGDVQFLLDFAIIGRE